ncbi:hypothetical protein LCGC14_2009520, partial [marine sediment metagenome]
MAQKNPPGERIKLWSDFSAGVGYLVDDGRTPGMYQASGLLGLRGELRPAPFKNTVTIGTDEAHHYQYFFEEALNNQTPVHDADSTGKANASTTLTVSHTVANQPNRVLLVWIGYDNSPGWAGDGVTYNGTAMTLSKVAWHATSFCGMDLFSLVAPDVGTHDIVMTITPAMNVVMIAASFYKASQSVPIRSIFGPAGQTGDGTEITQTGIDSSSDEIMVMGSATLVNTTDTVDGAETLIGTNINDGNDIRGTAGFKAGSASGSLTHTLGSSGKFVKVGASVVGASGANRPGYLYGMRGAAAGNTPCYLDKLDLFNNSFATLEAGSHELTSLLKPGQPARYQGFWYLPTGASKDPRKLTVGEGAVVDDTLAAETSGNGGDHLGNLNGQMIQGLTGSGFIILKVDGTPTTDADWGSYFPVGDKEVRAAAVSGLAGLSWCMTDEGLFSFNNKARSRLVFEDFNLSTSLEHMAMVPWFDGVVMGTPQGIFYYVPGERPINIGFTGKNNSGVPPVGVTELLSGRFLGVDTYGSFIYTIYQPDPTTTTALIMYAEAISDPRDSTINWNVLGGVTLDHVSRFAGIHVADSGFPISAATETIPTLWFGEQGSPRYMRLSSTGGPIKTRTIEERANLSGDAFMSELRFTEPVDLTEIVVHTSRDM